ncbi:regulatory protein RecX [Sulfuriferula plumbiphila]|uniref:Regulatory protein RecX n=1 Tax=Sulfuriferula plumbiphila TaxID=171865 RepID=A0A512LAP6_9PROT|nr:recombination regulator RecX [Sulfuriferula plumbiphila]BBP03371.1 regulatory protein RecX [Sulfuriferula plumbiphila]GEP31547.1 regulatory protein RecX [Sulfuriferula plumbiphila]
MPKPPEKSLRARALEALSRREHSRMELMRKLAPHTDSPDELNTLLDDLQARGWLSDARYAEQMVNARQSRYGSRKLAFELREKGIDEDLINTTLANVRDTELERARAVWARKFGQIPASAQEQARQIRFLQSRGFVWDVIRKILGTIE